MSAYSSIPFAGLDILPFGTLLEVDFSLTIEYMQVDYWVEEFASIMTFATGSCTDDITVLVHDGEHFFVIVLFHLYRIKSDESP